MTRTITEALVAAVIAVCTASGAMAQNVQPDTYLSPALTGSDFGGVLTGIVVNRPTLVFVKGSNDICPDAAARMDRAARSVPNLAVVIGKPSATSGIKDQSWVMLFTPGLDYRIVHPRTFGMVGFNACVYGDKLVDFLTARLAASTALLEVHQRIQAIAVEKQSIGRRLIELSKIDLEQRSDAERDEGRTLFWKQEDLITEEQTLRQKIGEILDREMADARLQPERLSPQ